MAASKSPRLRLLHIYNEIETLIPYFLDVTFEDFFRDYLKIRATERAILIISEATKSLPDDLLSQRPDVEWRAIRSIGNLLRHEYERIDPAVLWSIVHDQLPELRDAVITLLEIES